MNSAIDQERFVSPFAGTPHTTITTGEGGTPGFTVRPCEMTPEGVIWAERLTWTSLFAIGAAMFFALVRLELDGWVWAACPFALLLLVNPVFHFWWRTLATENTLVFTPEALKVREAGSWKTYNRTLTHRFVMMQHDRAREETEKREMQIQQAQRDGQIINPKRYYADSYHIILQYLGHRHDLLDVYDKNRALAVLARLKACDEVMDNVAKMGDGEALGPQDQWGEQAGGLPD